MLEIERAIVDWLEANGVDCSERNGEWLFNVEGRELSVTEAALSVYRALDKAA